MESWIYLYINDTEMTIGCYSMRGCRVLRYLIMCGVSMMSCDCDVFRLLRRTVCHAPGMSRAHTCPFGVQVQALSQVRVAAVACGLHHTVTVDVHGAAYAWGSMYSMSMLFPSSPSPHCHTQQRLPYYCLIISPLLCLYFVANSPHVRVFRSTTATPLPTASH